MPTYPGLTLGPLPVLRINATLGSALVPGVVTVSKAAHRHIAEKHPVEYPDIMAVLPGVIANPAFIGRDPAHPHAFYLVDAFIAQNLPFALAAIGFTLTPGSTYPLASAYGLKASQFTSRVKAGRIVPLLP